MPFNKFVEEETKAYANIILGSKPLLNMGNDCLVLGSFIYFRPALNNLKHARASNFSLESDRFKLDPGSYVQLFDREKKKEGFCLVYIHQFHYLLKFHYIFFHRDTFFTSDER